uniref:SAP30 binding protein n=1 Tax=Apteryx owenii TaxID=8824 RepID=A0A8B9Q0U1_APTOW
MAAAKRSVLSSLAVYAEDSDPESDSEAGAAGSDGGAATGEKGGLVSVGYGDDDFTRLDGDEDGYEEEDDENSRQSPLFQRECGTCLLMRSKSHLSLLADALTTYSIYEKLIQFCSIDELGTNYPKDMFDPHGWSEDSYYEALAKAQKIEMDKLEKAKKERTKIEFVTGTKKGTTTSAASTTTTTASTTVGDAQKRKSKWDSAIPVTTIAQPTILTTTATLPGVVTVTTSASGSKTTVISAVGTIVKKAKQ